MRTLLALAAVAVVAMACRETPSEPQVSGGGMGAGTPIAVTPAAPAPGTVVTFDSGNLPAGPRTWSFGDGTGDSGIVVSHTFAIAGVYTVRLLLDDGSGDPAEHLLLLQVGDGPAEPERAVDPYQRAGR